VGIVYRQLTHSSNQKTFFRIYDTFVSSMTSDTSLNRLTSNDPYMGRTALLTSKRCILFIY